MALVVNRSLQPGLKQGQAYDCHLLDLSSSGQQIVTGHDFEAYSVVQE